MQKFAKLFLMSLLVTMTTLFILAGQAAHYGGNKGGFMFFYTITNMPETVVTNDLGIIVTNAATFPTNYHAYNLLCQVGCGGIQQPPGSVILGLWYVQDLGPAYGVGAASCITPICPTGKSMSITGKLLFADATDTGGDGTSLIGIHPIVEITQWISTWYGGDDCISIDEPDGTELVPYLGPRFTPFAWDLSPYVY